jgi:hypothetical protein
MGFYRAVLCFFYFLARDLFCLLIPMNEKKNFVACSSRIT